MSATTEPIDTLSLRIAAALDYTELWADDEMHTHYVWLIKQMMGTIADAGGPEVLTTAELVATIIAWLPPHTRLISIGKQPTRDAVVLNLVRPGDGTA